MNAAEHGGLMHTKSTETILAQIKKSAEASAKERRERVTSAHLLAVIAGEETPAARLLTERGLTPDRLLRAARGSVSPTRVEGRTLASRFDLPGRRVTDTRIS